MLTRRRSGVCMYTLSRYGGDEYECLCGGTSCEYSFKPSHGVSYLHLGKAFTRRLKAESCLRLLAQRILFRTP